VTENTGISAAAARGPGTPGMLAPGTRVAGYVIEEQVGAGGMAVVYRARDDVLGRLVAVKVLSPALAADEAFRARFLRESRAVAAVDEPHIVPVYGAGEADGLLYIATRFVAGGDLSRLQRAAGGRLAPDRAAGLIAQVAGALDAAHCTGLVHRDVKPGNILVESTPGRPEYAYLSDFGLSKSTAATSGLTAAGQFMGTPDYSAPEQIAGEAVDGRADQYSLACVAFSLLTGAVPFARGDTVAVLFAHVNAPAPALTAIRPELPAAVDLVMAKAMAKDPAGRYESCAAFARALRGALASPAGAFPGGPAAAFAAAGYEATVTARDWPDGPGPADQVARPHPAAPTGPAGWPGAAAPAGSAGWPAPPAPTGPAGWQAPQPPAEPGGRAGPQAPAVPTGWAGPQAATGPAGWPAGPAPAGPTGWAGPQPPTGAAGWPTGPAPSGPAVTFPQGAAGPYGGAPPGQPWLPGPGQALRPPRRNTGLIVGLSVGAAVLVLVAVLVGVNQSGPPGKALGSSGGTNVSASGSAASLAGTLTAPGGAPLSDAFFSADGTYVAAAGTGADVYIWNTATRRLVQAVSVAAGDRADPVGFSADDRTLYVIDSAAKRLYDFDVATGQAPNIYALPSGATWGDNWDSGVLAAIASDGSIGVYDMATGKLRAQVQNPGTARVAAVRPDGDGKYLVVSDEDGRAYLVASASGDVVGTFGYTYSAAEANVPSISLNGNTVYVPGGPAGPAQLWDVTTRSYVTPAGEQWPKRDNGITFSTDGTVVITSPSFSSDTVDTWDIATHAHLSTVTVPGSADEELLSVTPGAGEVLTTGLLDSATGTFSKLSIWKMP
jgi:hypothetical protein